VRQAPTPIQAAVFSYITLLDDPTLPLVDFSARETALSYLSDLSRRARDQQADTQYILDHPSEFYSSPADLPLLAAELKALIDFRTIIQARAVSCVSAAGNCDVIATQFPSPTSRPARR